MRRKEPYLTPCQTVKMGKWTTDETRSFRPLHVHNDDQLYSSFPFFDIFEIKMKKSAAIG